MYRGTSSPIFDIPEFPTLRRIKPLPKRRRTSGPVPTQENNAPSSSPPLPSNNISSQLPTNVIPPTFLQTAPELLQRPPPPPPPPTLALPSLPIVDALLPNLTPEELFSHADSLSTRIALQNYYLPILGNVQNFLAGHHHHHHHGASSSSEPTSLSSVENNNNNNNTAAATAAAAALAAVTSAGRNSGPIPPMPTLSDLDSIEFGVHFAAAAAAAAAAGIHMGGSNVNSLLMGTGTEPEEVGEEEERLRRTGNRKKRKVPANLGGSPRSNNAVQDATTIVEDDDGPVTGGGGFLSAAGREYDSSPSSPVYPPPSFPGQMSMLKRKKGRLTAVTLAGLQHKEMLKKRKRQVGSSQAGGDTFAIDQALSVYFPFGEDATAVVKKKKEVRKSKRKTVRLARAMKILMEMPDRKNRHPDAVPFPEGEFEFRCESASSKRLGCIKEEVALLRKRFEAEEQAEKVTKGVKKNRVKRERQEKERGRTKENGPAPPEETTKIVAEKASKGKKKKKGSALANASNPHHLRNYVPSRLPHNNNNSDNSDNHIWPLAVRFLAAEIPSKGGKGKTGFTAPGEEWICAFCEYELFYGDSEVEYGRGIRNRKRILRRRRRAAERAAEVNRDL